MSLLAARGVARVRSGRTVLEIAGLAFEPATISVFCGANGAGKSTLLAILGLLDHPDRGEIAFAGKTLSSHGDWFAARRQVTLVEQNPYVFPGSVFDNAAYGLKLRGVGAAEIAARTGEALKLVDLDGFAKRRARGLSGGEIQRLSIARALALKPRVLVLDEPTAHVDSGRVAAVEALVKRVKEDGAAVIIATHDHGQALRLADRLYHLEDGRMGGPRVFPGADIERFEV